MLARRMALTLRVGAIVFALSALALVAAPQSFLEFLKIEKSPGGYSEELVWAMRMMGVCLLIASVMMPLVAAFAPERALRQVGVLMVGICSLLTLLTFLTPAPWGMGKVGYALVGALFTLTYIYGLRGRSRNH
jgi:O-antigen/teichoic acid export membrane protein